MLVGSQRGNRAQERLTVTSVGCEVCMAVVRRWRQFVPLKHWCPCTGLWTNSLTHSLTHSMELSPSEACGSSASKELPYLLCMLEGHKSGAWPYPVPDESSQCPPMLLQFTFDSIPSVPRSCKHSFCFRFPHQNCVHSPPHINAVWSTISSTFAWSP